LAQQGAALGEVVERAEQLLARQPAPARPPGRTRIVLGFACARSDTRRLRKRQLVRGTAQVRDQDLRVEGVDPGVLGRLAGQKLGRGGASVPYVVGIATIEGSRLHCVQWTLTSVSGEAELLADVLARLEAHG